MMFPAVPAVPAVSNLSNAPRARLKVADTLKDWAPTFDDVFVAHCEGPGARRRQAKLPQCSQIRARLRWGLSQEWAQKCCNQRCLQKVEQDQPFLTRVVKWRRAWASARVL